MQKLVTIYLDSHAYMDGKWIKGTHGDKHGFVEEHLQKDLAAGWQVKSVVGLGGRADIGTSGWLAVLLERGV